MIEEFKNNKEKYKLLIPGSGHPAIFDHPSEISNHKVK
jgi:hypothetical protein